MSSNKITDLFAGYIITQCRPLLACTVERETMMIINTLKFRGNHMYSVLTLNTHNPALLDMILVNSDYFLDPLKPKLV
jgi:hypothetical protein